MSVPAGWRPAMLSYACPKCGAGEGQACRTLTTGTRVYQPHAARALGAPRCRSCSRRLPADALPGERCPKCNLVSDLEVERATVHRRREP